MKITTIVISLACLSQVALADDLTTPTPTPTPALYLGRPGRNGTVWRQEQIARRDEQQSTADSKAQARAKQKANRAAGQATQAEARQAARAREQAQREVAAQNRRETQSEKPQLTSDLMSRMGFSPKEIAAQKAKEQSTSAASKEAATPTPPGH